MKKIYICTASQKCKILCIRVPALNFKYTYILIEKMSVVHSVNNPM